MGAGRASRGSRNAASAPSCARSGLRETFEMEYRLRRYDGEYRWVLDVGGPIHDAGGRFAGFRRKLR